MKKFTRYFISLSFLLIFNLLSSHAIAQIDEVVVTGQQDSGSSSSNNDFHSGSTVIMDNSQYSQMVTAGYTTYAAIRKRRCEAAKREMVLAESTCTANAVTDLGINQATCTNLSYTGSGTVTLKIGAVFSGGVTGSVTYSTGGGCRSDWANLAAAQTAWCKVNTAKADVAAYKAGGACEGQ